MKSLAFLLLVLVGCSTASHRAHLKPQRTDHMAVTSGSFISDTRTEAVKLAVNVSVAEPPKKANFLRVTFPNPATNEPGETKVLPLTSATSYTASSSPIRSAEYSESFPILVQMTADMEGNDVIEELTQYVRFELPPQVRAERDLPK